MLVFYLALFSLYFLILPFIMAKYPSSRVGLSYFPLFFFFPFFWGFGGGRGRRAPAGRQQQEEQSDTMESTISAKYSGVQDNIDPETYMNMMSGESHWRIIAIIALCAVFVLVTAIIVLFFV